jgi:hemolysin activation/secretion protein
VPLQSIGGATVTVASFSFVGNVLLTNDELQTAVASFVGHPIDFNGLQNAAIAVAGAYRKKGWVVRAYLPQQEIEDGTVTIQIVEGRFGLVKVEGGPTRVRAGRLMRIIEAAQEPGEPLSAAALDRGLLLINDLPGIVTSGRLAPGLKQSETDLILTAEDGALVSGSVTGDNAGSRFTGAARLVAAASLNSRLGLGDRADALLLHSDGNDYVQFAYSLPLTAGGWRAGANVSHLEYDIVTKEFDALDAHGSSDSFGLEASYPLIRSRLTNLYFTTTVDQNRFDNRSGGEATTDYSVQTATAGLSGNRFDHGGFNTASLMTTYGTVDLSGSPNALADSLTTRTEGSFVKLVLALSRLQVINSHLSLFAGVSGQMANKNLDSSEKLYLGGSHGVRAYPEDEAGGSEGVLVNLEARTRFAESFTLTGFVDWGQVRVNTKNDFAGATALNTLALKGVGVSVGWLAGFGLNVQATYARRIGSNPNPTLTGDDQDGTLQKNRLWLQASMPF